MSTQRGKEQLSGAKAPSNIGGNVQGVSKKRDPNMEELYVLELKESRGGLEPVRFAIEIPTVSEETYEKVVKEVEATGYNFIAVIRPVSIQDLLAEDEQLVVEGQRKERRLGCASDPVFSSSAHVIRTLVSPEMEIAINPDKFKIEDSYSFLDPPSINGKKNMIKEEEARWKKQLPEDIRPFVGMYMVDPSTLSQLEDAYMDKNDGKFLLPDYFASTDIQTVPLNVADVGRYDPATMCSSKGMRFVLDWYRSEFRPTFAVSVVVLPRKLAV